MAVLLALCASTLFGVADFLGGSSARRIHPTITAFASQVAGLVVLFAVALLGGGALIGGDLALGAAAGAIGAVALIAPGFGGIVPVRPALLADYFGTKHFGQINGWGRLMFTTGGAVGAWLVGRIFDVTDGYTVAWLVASLTVLAGVPIMLLATPPTDLMRQYQDEADVAWEAEQAAARRAAAPPEGEVDGQPAAQS